MYDFNPHVFSDKVRQALSDIRYHVKLSSLFYSLTWSPWFGKAEVQSLWEISTKPERKHLPLFCQVQLKPIFYKAHDYLHRMQKVNEVLTPTSFKT